MTDLRRTKLINSLAKACGAQMFGGQPVVNDDVLKNMSLLINPLSDNTLFVPRFTDLLFKGIRSMERQVPSIQYPPEMMKERAELIMKSFNEPLTDVEQQRLNEIHAHLDRLEEPLWKARFDYLNSILEAAEQSAQRVKDISARIKAHENRDITPYDLLKEDIDAARPSRE